MANVRATASREDLAALVRAGCGREPVSVERLTGGTSKGVYRVAPDDGSTVVAYLRDPAEDSRSGPVDGVEAFPRARELLTAAGVRTPRVVVADRARTPHPAEYALAEDVRGPRLGEIALTPHPSLVAGPLRLLDGHFPDRAGMMSIARENVERTRGYVR